jgi:hypothetical protein
MFLDKEQHGIYRIDININLTPKVSNNADFSFKNTNMMTHINIKIFLSDILTNNLYAFLFI